MRALYATDPDRAVIVVAILILVAVMAGVYAGDRNGRRPPPD